MGKRGSVAVTTPPVVLAPTRIKIISMGSGGSGKSCIIKRFCEERFVTKYIATIGVDYGVKPVQVDGEDVRVNFWVSPLIRAFLSLMCKCHDAGSVWTL
jgi:GTPase SAR1 family protein